jgi:hypothetical protein
MFIHRRPFAAALATIATSSLMIMVDVLMR